MNTFFFFFSVPYSFPSGHHFCSPPCYAQWSSSLFSHTLLRTEVAYTDKLQSWAFKLESITLVFCLTFPFCDQQGPRKCEGVSSIFPVHNQPATCFLWVGRTLAFLFPLIYFSIPFNFLFLVATLFLCSYKQAVTRSP